MNLTDPTRIFTALALLFGMVFVFLVPPFQSPDEYNHFFRAVQVSEGRFFPEIKNNNRLGGTLPSGLDSLKQAFLPLKSDYAAKITPDEILAAFTYSGDPEDREFIDFPNTAIYAPTAYLPQAIAIALVQHFTDRMLVLFYAARLGNLLFWVALIWAALRQIPFLRRTMAVLALLPASLVVASTCNADVITNGLAFYAIAVFCRGTITLFRQQGTGAGSIAVIALNKLVFAPMALLAGIDQKNGWRGAIKKSLFPLVIALLAAGWWGYLAGQWFIPYDRYDPAVRDQQTLNPGVDPPAQINYILTNPLSCSKAVSRSFLRAVPSLSAHVVGKFGWEKNYLPRWMLFLLWGALLAIMLSEPNPLSLSQRAWAAGVVAVCVALWAITMYTLWCPVGSPELDNWQGRYFVPLGPVCALVIGAGWESRWMNRVFPFVVLALILGNLLMVCSIVQRYFIT